jgi:hypothetical protein
MSDFEIYQGDSIALAFDLSPKQDMSGWTARVMVKRGLLSEALYDETISTLALDNEALIGGITATVTSALNVGNYWIYTELSNADGSLKKEIHQALKVLAQGVF